MALARVNQPCPNNTAFSRLRVQQVFEEAVVGSSDAPKPPLSEALGRLLYLVHLAVLLWRLLDKSSNQRATAALVSLTQQLLVTVPGLTRRRGTVQTDGSRARYVERRPYGACRSGVR